MNQLVVYLRCLFQGASVMLSDTSKLKVSGDFNLEVFNIETDFFGDLHCSSRFTDMLCDAQAQYGDYSELDMCPMWGMWGKERGE